MDNTTFFISLKTKLNSFEYFIKGTLLMTQYVQIHLSKVALKKVLASAYSYTIQPNSNLVKTEKIPLWLPI